MPGISSSHATTTVSVSVSVAISSDASRAVVKLVGDLDMEARMELDDAVDQLTAAAPDRIDVDVSEVTYVGAVLPNFLVQVRETLPAESVLTVLHPSPATLFVLRMTDMTAIADIADAA